MQPETQFARLGRDRIAYQVFGNGPPDVVLIVGSFSHMDVLWEDPAAALFFRNLASFARVIRFDRLGVGASDPLSLDPLPPWESYAEELATVLDTVGVQEAAIIAQLDAGPMALFFAATRPERTTALVLSNTSAKWVAGDDYPIGLPRQVVDTVIAQFDQHWGTENMAALVVPSRAHDEQFRRWYAKLNRAATRPRAVLALLQALSEIDARPLLSQVQAPTLILHRQDFLFMPIEHGRYLAEHIPGARLIELPGSDPGLMWEDQQLAVDHLEEFLTGVRHGPDSTRVLAAVLFTDIVGSTEQAGRLGDRRWRELLNVHDELAGRLVEEAGGRLIKTTGDGILATFDGPGRGIRCAAALRNQLRGIGVELRAGLHIGEVELRGGDVGGMAVHVAARIMAAAGTGEILTSRTVRDLMVGSDVALEDRGTQSLKGVEGSWELFTVTRA